VCVDPLLVFTAVSHEMFRWGLLPSPMLVFFLSSRQPFPTKQRNSVLEKFCKMRLVRSTCRNCDLLVGINLRCASIKLPINICF